MTATITAVPDDAFPSTHDRRRSRVGLRLAMLAAAGLAATSSTARAAERHDPGSATRAQQTQLVSKWAAAWNSSDAARMGKLFTAAGVYTDHAFEVSFTGRKEVASWVDITADGVEHLRVKVDEVISSRSSIAVRWRFSGQINGAPKPFTVPVATLIKTEGRKISSLGDFYNRADVLRQSGLPLDMSFGPPSA